MRAIAGALLALSLAAAGCAHQAPKAQPRGSAPTESASVATSQVAASSNGSLGLEAPDRPCYQCFWQNYSPAFRDELISFYEGYSTNDPLIDADRKYLLARVRGDATALCAARRAFETLAAAEDDPARRLLAAETAAFTAAECGADPGAAFATAAVAARAAGQQWKAGVYLDVEMGRFRPQFGDEVIMRRPAAPPGVTSYVLGESAIHLKPGERIGAQVERTARDWISFQLSYDLTGRPPATDAIITWHEGARIREILEATPATVLPLEGILAAKQADRWFAADEKGVFRFEVLPDKLEYPTSRTWRGLALLVDTHGISSLVEPSVREGAALVVGCGDHPEKMKAAFHLAARGIDVYFPCDRFVGEILGYDAPGTLIGSGPVRASGDGAVIGDRPVMFSVDETVVVEDTHVNSTDRYYDAAARYFRRLTEMVPLHLEIVTVDGSGQSERITRRAEELGASAIALRVMTDKDAAPVRAWLSASPRNRAVLFHTAPYPAGNALFVDYPGQTTFGDPRPRFVTAGKE